MRPSKRRAAQRSPCMQAASLCLSSCRYTRRGNAMTAIRKVGMLGLGSMGGPMARHLIDKGYSVCGYDPQEPARRAAARLGVQVMDSARDVARASELAIIVVGFDHEVETVMFGPRGVMEGAGAGLIIA